ncbi:MAG TPA: hypothetical protein VGM76_03455 [Lacipirellulaceae bacterium]|jgi:hypothetical protein
MTAFDMLRFRSLIALVTSAGAWFLDKIAELCASLSHDRDLATIPNGHPWRDGIFPLGQPREIVHPAPWLSYRQGSDSRGRILPWPSPGFHGRWSPATVIVSSAVLRGPTNRDGI